MLACDINYGTLTAAPYQGCYNPAMSDKLVEIGSASDESVSENDEIHPLAEGEQSSNGNLIENSPVGKDEYIHIKRSYVHIALLLIFFTIGLVTGYLMWGRESSPSTGLVSRGTNPQEYVRFDIPIDNQPSIGPEDAPIVIVEFSDFNCPYCRKWHQETFKALLESYPDQIQFVYRDYPILTQESINAAQAAACANEQGAYWEYHNALFSGDYDLGSTAYEAYAVELGLEAQELLDCVESGRYEDEIDNDAQFASSLGITGTPTFFINGIPLVGAQPISSFSKIIDDELGT